MKIKTSIVFFLFLSLNIFPQEAQQPYTDILGQEPETSVEEQETKPAENPEPTESIPQHPDSQKHDTETKIDADKPTENSNAQPEQKINKTTEKNESQTETATESETGKTSADEQPTDSTDQATETPEAEKTAHPADEKKEEPDEQKDASPEDTESSQKDKTLPNKNEESKTPEQEEIERLEAEKKKQEQSIADAKKLLKERTKIPHLFEGGVTAIAAHFSTSFFAGGKDGFLTKYSYPNLEPDTWQISRFPIKYLAIHPKGKYIAAYESDGFGLHRVSLWDWEEKKQVFVKRFTGAVVSLSWSAQGSFLFVGTASLEGITVFDLHGNPQKLFDAPPGIVLLAATGLNEKNIVTYGETGRLVYTNVKKKKILTQFITESKLETPALIKNYTQIIGYKNNKVYVVKADGGEVLAEYPAKNAIFASKITDSLPIWIERSSKRNYWHLRQGNKTSGDFALPNKAVITSARHIQSSIILGTDKGVLYKMQQKPDGSVTLTELTPEYYSPVSDVQSAGSLLYFLSEGKIYSLTEPEAEPALIYAKAKGDRFLLYENGFIIWSSKKTAPIYYYSQDLQTEKIIFRPRSAITTLSVYKDTIAFAEPFSGVSLINIITAKRTFFYKAVGIQEALQINDDSVLVSKSASDGLSSPLFLINIQTEEIFPFTIQGDFAFGLSIDADQPNYLAFFLLQQKPENVKTDLIGMRINQNKISESTFTVLLSYKDEDIDPSLYLRKYVILTNLGKNSLVAQNKRIRETYRLPRDYALPKKSCIIKSFLISLNTDGSLSWYSQNGKRFIKTIRLKETDI
ncbi:hypothetical protein DWQ65_11965 [Treponema phagedenis]|uniref:WD40 repeat domain-containing protein n=1 Tax=Treponema phagedenis TaxID=162 RepID=A0A0B7GW90_TREPH|nr:WD40 repeat domain-containing protein [Treponema phagedenis]QEJ94557.1 hypothetical protein FUT79_04630 [Treponema phagedenis]QSH94223.1 hypothetical protein C5O78_04045 [Treponema phagedenis]QSI00760.1 hypothetical protein DWQ65_11965 [Treponema phagedenis]CEM61240.1 conserved exported hypothetical protein [Treponema phagedenis]